MSSAPTAAEIARDAGWLAQAFDPSARAVRLVAMDEEAYRRASFLDDRLLQSPVDAVIQPWNGVAASVSSATRRDARWIFHIGHVGSTLIARLLGELDSVLSVREPRILRDLTVVGADERASMMPAVQALMSRTFAPHQTALVKATSFVSELAPELVPAGERALFVHAGPLAYIETILAGPNSRVELRHLAESRRSRSAGRIGNLPPPANDADLAAHAWACEMTALEQAAAKMTDRSLGWLDFDDFLAGMPLGLRRAAEHFGFPFEGARLDAIATGPLTTRYSKALEYDYSPALRAELRAEASRDNRRDIINALGALERAASGSPLLARALDRSPLETLNMYRILPLLTPAEVDQCRKIAASTQFIDGRVTNPHNKAKNNQQLHDAAAYRQTSQLLLQAFQRSPEFAEFAFPVRIAPPMVTRYQPGMHYGAHADAAFIQLPGGAVRSDLSCTIFLNDPASYEGGALHVRLGDADLRFKLQPGQAIVYPSDTLHQVEPVTKGERLVAITFIQSRIPDASKRYMLFELNEVAALEGLKMDPENFSRLQLVQQNLLRLLADPA